MINKVINGTCEAINQNFGDDYEIYTESVKQGFQEPCFFVVPLSTEIRRQNQTTFYINTSLDIHYFPQSNNEQVAEVLNVATMLFQVLENIKVASGTFIRAQKMNYEIVDDVLHFFVDYSGWVKFERRDELMKILNVERARLRNGK